MEEDQWYLSRDEGYEFPSVQEGMPYEKELLFREQGVCLIQVIGNRLELPTYVVATASVLFHRFYMRESFYDYKLQNIAQACLFIASKSDEASRRPEDLAKSWLYHPDREVSERRINAFVKNLLHYELIVLEVTCFDLFIDHPYNDLLDFIVELDVSPEIANIALAYINDSYRLPFCIWYDPKSIAVAALLVAYTSSKTPFPQDPDTHWGHYLSDNYRLIGDIVESMMEIYKISKLASPAGSTDDEK